MHNKVRGSPTNCQYAEGSFTSGHTGPCGFFQISFNQYQRKRLKTLCPRNQVSGYLVFYLFIFFFEKSFQGYYRARSGSKLFAKVISRRHYEAKS